MLVYKLMKVIFYLIRSVADVCDVFSMLANDASKQGKSMFSAGKVFVSMSTAANMLTLRVITTVFF